MFQIAIAIAKHCFSFSQIVTNLETPHSAMCRGLQQKVRKTRLCWDPTSTSIVIWTGLALAICDFCFLHVATICPKTIIDVQYVSFFRDFPYILYKTNWMKTALLTWFLIPPGPYSCNWDSLCVLCDPTYREAAHVCESNTWRQPRLPHGRLHMKINYLLNDLSEHIRPSKNMYCWHYSFVDASPCLWNPSVRFRSCLQRPPTFFWGKS